jgi:tetratricopeptide (TPR) repeat protein
MTALEKYREIIKKSATVESYVDASKIVNAYDKLNELGSHELDDLLFEYARVGIKNKYLKASIDDYLYLDEEWLFKLAEYRSMFDIIDEYSEEVFAEIDSEEVLEKAEKLKDQGNITEAIKCYEEALELKPGDEKILQKLFEIMEDGSQKPHETEQYKEMPAFIIANLNGLTSDSFICKTSSLGDAQYRGDVQQDQKPSKAVYTLGEPIIVYIEMPLENDGYLAVFHYDEKYNLNMLFPKEISDDTFVNAGKEIRVGLTAEEPIGRQYIKAIWTDKQTIQSAAIDFDDNESVAAAIKEFLKTIYEIDDIKWLESVKDFEIIEKP